MSRTIRVYWPNQRSGWKNFNWGGVIDHRSVVQISASEGVITEQLGSILDGIGRFRGQAGIYVKNVRPHQDEGGGGGVEFYLQIDWNQPLNVVTDITVFDPPENGHIVG